MGTDELSLQKFVMTALLPIPFLFKLLAVTMIALLLTSDGHVLEAVQRLLQFAHRFVEMDSLLALKPVTMGTHQMMIFVILLAQDQLTAGIVTEEARLEPLNVKKFVTMEKELAEKDVMQD